MKKVNYFISPLKKQMMGIILKRKNKGWVKVTLLSPSDVK